MMQFSLPLGQRWEPAVGRHNRSPQAFVDGQTPVR